MQIPRPFKSIAASCAALALTACAGNYAPPAPSAGVGAHVSNSLARTIEYATPSQSTRVFLSDNYAGVIDEYRADGKLSGTLEGFSGPDGLFVDANSTLWVANDTSYAVMSFPKPYVQPGTTLHDVAGYPADVAVDGASGTIGVATSGSTSGGYPSVSFYRPGARYPCKTIVGRAFYGIYSAAFDGNGSLYLVGAKLSGATLLGIVRGACAATKISPLRAKNALVYATSVRVSSGGDILIMNQNGSPEIDAYAPPVGNDLGTPVARTTLSNPDRADFAAFALSEDGKAVWVAAFGTRSFYEFAFPQGGTPIGTFSTTALFATGIAVDPPNLP